MLLFKDRGVACFYASPQVLLASPLSLDGDRMSDLGLISVQYSAFYNTVVGSYFFIAVHVNNSQFLYKRNAFFFFSFLKTKLKAYSGVLLNRRFKILSELNKT